MMEGAEYDKLLKLKYKYSDTMDITVGRSILSKEEDCQEIAQEIEDKYRRCKETILLLGCSTGCEAKKYMKHKEKQ